MEEYITSKQNTTIQHVRKLLTSHAYRLACGEFVADGIKLLQEALMWKADVRLIILKEGINIPDIPDSVRVIRVPESLMNSVSNMNAPQGALFVCGRPDRAPLSICPGTLILDEIRDPGNVGTILRTADAMNVPVVLCGTCADPFNEKTVRASMGAVFRTKLQFASDDEVIDQCINKKIPLAATALHTSSVDIRKVDVKQLAVIIGSEGSGVRQTLIDAADYKLIIPMSDRCESLNAAAAATIVLWQMQNV